MYRTPHERYHTRRQTHSRRRRPWVVERLEARLLLATIANASLSTATPLIIPSDVTSGPIAPGAPVFYQISPAADALLVARNHTQGALTRLSLLDSQGNVLIQSDGQSASDPDDLIVQHVVAGTDYLEVESLGGIGHFTLSVNLTQSSQPSDTPLSQTARSLAGPLIVFGDFNSDGRLDFATPDGVHQGGGDGSFRTPAAPLPISSLITQTVAMAGGDFNDDGHPDLVVAGDAAAHGFSLGVVELLLGNADGTFRALAPIVLGAFSPTALVVGEFNGDTHADLAIAGLSSSGAGQVKLLSGNGDGSFGAPTTVDLGGLAPSSLLGGDFNGDGQADLAAVGEDVSGQSEVELLLGQRDGTFTASSPIGAGTFHVSVAVAADFNGDGSTDLALSGTDPVAGQNLVEVLLGSASGTLIPASGADLGSVSPRALAAVDTGGTGFPDLVAAGVDMTGHTQVLVLPGNHDGTFNAAQSIDLGAISQGALTPSALFSGDYNGDGVADLALAGNSSSGGGVTILVGHGQGSFSTTSPIRLDQLPPTYLATSDFSGDGRADVVLAGVDPSTGGGRIALLPGNGDGTFGTARSVDPVGLVPTALVTGDFNGDGRSDLAFAGTESPGTLGVVVLLGDSGGTFSVGSTTVLGLTALPSALVAGDFDGDHRTDLAIVGVDASGNTSAEVLLGNSDGTFRRTTPTSLGALNPVAFAVADFNGDGRADLAVAGTGGDGKGVIDILFGDGDGRLHAGPSFALGDLNPAALAAGDFAGNGHAGLAVAGTGPNVQGQVEVFPGNGDGTFQADSLINLGTLFVPAVLQSSDVNGDGRADLVVAGVGPSLQGQYALLLSNGNGTFRALSPSGLGAIPPSPLLVGDFNGDGRTDLLFASAGGQGPVAVLLGHGDATFGASGAISLGAGSPTFVAAGDFNNDNHADLAVTTLDPDGQSHVAMLLGEGDGTFQAGTNIDLGTFSPMALVSADFNGDGRADLAVAGLDSTTGNILVDVFLGKGDGTFVPGSSINVGSIPVSMGQIGFFVELSALLLVAGDFNGDGHTDLAVAENITGALGQGLVEVLTNDGTGTFGAPSPINLGFFAQPTALAAGDFNGDGRTDLAVAGLDLFGQAGAEVLLSNGDGTFANPTPVLPGNFSFPPVLAAGDFENDGRADLVLAGPSAATGQEQLAILAGNADGTLSARATIGLGLFSPTALVAGDFNGDDHLDLVAVAGSGRISNAGSSGALVLFGNGDGTFTPPVESPLAATNNLLVAADLNGDGRSDLAIAGPDGITVALSRGDGQFVDPTTLSAAILDTPLVANPGDGTNDVFVVDQSGAILWRKGQPQSASSFGPPVKINPGFPARDITFVPTRRGGLLASVNQRDDAVSLYGFTDGQIQRVGQLTTDAVPAQIAAADINGDGNTDLVIRNAGNGTATVFLGDGNGGFVRAAGVPIGPGASDIALLPLDQTNRLDLVVTDRPSGTVSVFPGNGDGTFAAPARYAAGAGPYTEELAADGTLNLASLEATAGVTAGSFAGKGTLELATIDPGSNTLAILVGLGGGAFANPRRILTTTPATVIRAGDFNRDGNTDLALLGSDGVSVLLGDGAGGFGPPTTLDAGQSPTGLSVADVNGDGIPDLVVGNRFGDVLVLLGDGQGHFAPSRSIDTQIALAVAGGGAAGPATFALSNKGRDQITTQSGALGSPQTLAGQAQGVMTPGGLTLADVNGDGIPDMIVANSGANDILVYPGTGAGTYGPAQTFAVGTDPVSVTVADLTGAGIPDLIVANQGSNDLSILLGQGTGPSWTLTPGPRLQTGSGPVSTVVRDVNGDHIPDILVSDSQANDVRFLQGLGRGFFNDVNPPIFQTANDPGPLLVGNFAGPAGQASLVTLNAGSNDLSFFPNIASDVLPAPGNAVAHGGVFVGQSIASGGEFPIAAVAGDFGGGGQTDLLVANNTSGTLALFLGGATGPVLAETFVQANLPNPTSLAVDSAGDIFGATEGVDAAISVILGLGGGGVGGGGAGGVAGIAGGIGAGGFGVTLPPLAEQQISPLQPLSPGTLGLVETLLSVSVAMMITSVALAPAVGTAGSGSVPSELTAAPEVGNAQTAGTTSGGLPNQSQLQGIVFAGGAGEDGAETPEGEVESPAAAPPLPTQAAASPLARFVSGLDEAFARSRLKNHQRALFARRGDPGTTMPMLRALDSLLERWTAVIAAVADPLPRVTVALIRRGAALVQLVDAAVEALEAETVAPSVGAPNPTGPPPSSQASPARPAATAIASASLGLAALTRIHSDPIRPRAPQRHRRVIPARR
jgi:hypothetical protein